MRTIRFTMPGPPGKKQSPRVLKSGITFTPKGTVLAENLVKLCFQQVAPAGWEPWRGQVSVWIESYQAPPKNWPKWRREALAVEWAPVWNCCKTPDIDNRIKCIGDALNGLAYLDDRQICHIEFRKRWGRPRTEVTLTFAEEATRPAWLAWKGVLKSEGKAKEF